MKYSQISRFHYFSTDFRLIEGEFAGIGGYDYIFYESGIGLYPGRIFDYPANKNLNQSHNRVHVLGDLVVSYPLSARAFVTRSNIQRTYKLAEIDSLMGGTGGISSKLSIYTPQSYFMEFQQSGNNDFVAADADYIMPSYQTNRGNAALDFLHTRLGITYALNDLIDSGTRLPRGGEHAYAAAAFAGDSLRALQSSLGVLLDVPYWEVNMYDVLMAFADLSGAIPLKPTLSNLLFLDTSSTVSTTGSDLARHLLNAYSLDLPTSFIKLRPVISVTSEWTGGYGFAADWARPVTNCRLMGAEQGFINPWGKYYISPTNVNQGELYRISQIPKSTGVVATVTVEILLPPTYEFVAGDFRILLQDMVNGGYSNYAPTVADVGSVTIDADVWQIVSATFYKNPITNVLWTGEMVNGFAFGFQALANIANIQVAGMVVSVGLSPHDFADFKSDADVPDDPSMRQMNDKSFANAADEANFAKPHAYKMYFDVRQPSVAAAFDLPDQLGNAVDDGSFEVYGNGGTATFDIVSGEVAAVSKYFDNSFDGDWSILLDAGTALNFDFPISSSDIGESWVGGCAFGFNFDQGQTFIVTLAFLDSGESVLDSNSIVKSSADLIPGTWYDLPTPADVIPEGTVTGRVIISWGNGTAKAFVDCVYAGPNGITAEQSRIERAVRTRGDRIIGNMTLADGAWASMRAGQTVVTNAGERVRLRNVFVDDLTIQVAENDIEWSKVTSIEVLDEYLYWLRYQRLALSPVPRTIADIINARNEALSRQERQA